MIWKNRSLHSTNYRQYVEKTQHSSTNTKKKKKEEEEEEEEDEEENRIFFSLRYQSTVQNAREVSTNYTFYRDKLYRAERTATQMVHNKMISSRTSKPPRGFQYKLRTGAGTKKRKTGRMKGPVCFWSGKVHTAPVRIQNLSQVVLANQCKRVNQTLFLRVIQSQRGDAFDSELWSEWHTNHFEKLWPPLQGGKPRAAFSQTFFLGQCLAHHPDSNETKSFFFSVFLANPSFCCTVCKGREKQGNAFSTTKKVLCPSERVELLRNVNAEIYYRFESLSLYKLIFTNCSQETKKSNNNIEKGFCDLGGAVLQMNPFQTWKSCPTKETSSAFAVWFVNLKTSS